MGKRSTRPNKNIYQISREAAGFTREEASEAMEFVTSDRIEKIEYESSDPHPEEVMAMAKAYRAPSLCNYYCSNKCPIGKETVPEVKLKELSAITLEILSTLNNLEAEKNRLIAITVDGKISPEEMDDYRRIQKTLDDMALSVDSLKLWVNHSIANSDSTIS